MAAKSIVEIDVQDEKFQSFLEKFNEYQKALGELPEQWRGAVHGLGEAAKETERVRDGTEGITKAFADGVAALASVNDGLDRLNGNLEKATKTQTAFNRKSGGARNFLNKASKDAKSLAGHIKDATTSLLSWGTVLGLFSGLAGAGGLWGMNRLAGSASAQRFTAMGLGTTAGGLNSTAINYQKVLGNPVGTLGAIRDSQLDLSKRWTFNAMGVNPNQDPAKLLPQMIKSARDIFVRNGSTQQGAEAYGLTNYFTLDDLNRFKNMSDAEIDAMTKQAQKDSQRLQLTDQQLKQWQEFNIQLDRSKSSIEKTFIAGLGPLTPVLEKLSDAFSVALDELLKSPEIGRWIDGLSEGVKNFASYISSGDLRKDFDSFMASIREMGVTVDNVVKFMKGDTINDWMKQSEDSANAVADWIQEKTGFDTRSVGKKFKEASDSLSTPAGYGAGEPEQHAQSIKRHRSASAPDSYDRYFEEAARKYGQDPKLLKAIAAAESSWRPGIVNKKSGATGLMQVMPENFQPGENPFDPRDNIMAGARILRDGMNWANKHAGGDPVEALRYYNGGVRRGSKENIDYPGRVNEEFRNIYGADMPGTSTSNPVVQPVQQGSGKTDQILQQILDNQKRGHAQGLVVYNNTGGNAIVSSTQLGGFG